MDATDADRDRYMEKWYRRRRQDPSNYHLVLNTDWLGYDGAADLGVVADCREFVPAFTAAVSCGSFKYSNAWSVLVQSGRASASSCRWRGMSSIPMSCSTEAQCSAWRRSPDTASAPTAPRWGAGCGTC